MRRRLSSILAAAILLAVSAQAVSADALVADGDGLTPLAGSRVDLGIICHADTTVATVLVAVRATGHPTGRQVFENGATVTTAATVLSGIGLNATSSAPMLVMASNWRSQPNQTMSAPVPWEVAVTPDTLGRYRGSLEFRAQGLNRRGETITRVGRMNVVARVADCTPPVLVDMPTDLVLEADAPDGADLVYVPPTATDAVDGTVAVDCDMPASSRVPIDVTIVTCTAADAAGNAATGTFSVTVADTTAPVVDGVPNAITVTASDMSGETVDWTMPTASDVVDGSLPVTCDPAPGSLFAVGSTTVGCSVTDAAGNTASATFVVDVTPPPDPIPVEPVEPPAPPTTDPEPERPGQEETASGGSSPFAPAPAQPAQEPHAAAVLPDTSMSAGGGTAGALGLALVALAAASPALRRRLT